MSTKPSLAELLLARENEIKGAIIALQRELDGVHAAQQAYFSIVQAEASDNSDAADDKTIKEMIVEVLKGRPEGETSDAIIGLILKFFGREIPRTSLSPQLSRLKAQDNRVFYNEETRTWSLNEYRGDTKSEVGPQNLTSSDRRKRAIGIVRLLVCIRPVRKSLGTAMEVRMTTRR